MSEYGRQNELFGELPRSRSPNTIYWLLVFWRFRTLLQYHVAYNFEFHIYKSSPGCGMIVIVYEPGKAFPGVCFIPVRGAVFL